MTSEVSRWPLELCLECIVRHALHRKRRRAKLLEDVHDLERTNRIRSPELDLSACGFLTDCRANGEFRHVAQRDEADLTLPIAVNSRLPVGIVESDCGAEPDLHEVGRA